MFYSNSELLLQVILTISIGFVSILGDLALKNVANKILRALFDNATHATVGGLTWMLILVLSRKSIGNNIFYICLSFCMASFIDIDHFIKIENCKIIFVLHWEKRGLLHCTTFPLVLFFLLVTISKLFNEAKLELLGYITIASFLSHHIRDGTRRGLWFCPFGSTPPIPYYLYLAMDMILPYVISQVMSNNAWPRRNVQKLIPEDII